MPLCPGAGRDAGHDDLRRGLKAYAFKTPALAPAVASASLWRGCTPRPVSSGRDEAVSEHKPFARPLWSGGRLQDEGRLPAKSRSASWRHDQAAQFARSVPDFVLKGRFADLVKLDLQALEQEMGSTSRRRGPGGAASFGGEGRLVEFPHGKPISRPRADSAWKKPRRPGAWPGLGRDLKPLRIWRGTESSNPSLHR